MPPEPIRVRATISSIGVIAPGVVEIVLATTFSDQAVRLMAAVERKYSILMVSDEPAEEPPP